MLFLLGRKIRKHRNFKNKPKAAKKNNIATHDAARVL